MTDYADWNKKLKAHFGQWTEADIDCARVRERLRTGDLVSGTVISRAPFGAWLDIGVGFPALLEIVRMKDLDPVEYRAGNWCPEGTIISAQVSSFRDDAKQIGVTQTRLTETEDKTDAST